MSEENQYLSHYNPFYYSHHEINDSTFPFFNNNPMVAPTQNLQGFDPSYMSFTDCLHGSMDYNTLSRAFDMSCSSSEVITPIDDNLIKKAAGVGDSGGTSCENLSTPNSSMSCSSNEAAGDQEESVKSIIDKQPQGCEDGDEEKSKKGLVFFCFFFLLLEYGCSRVSI
jgi:hypothetical protein